MEGTCDCGAVGISLPHPPERLTACPCSFCVRLGVLWAYFPKESITVTGPTQSYSRAARQLAFHRCATCGVTTHWTPETVVWNNAGVNMRNFAPEDLAHLPIGPPE